MAEKSSSRSTGRRPVERRPSPAPQPPAAWLGEVQDELKNNILPFWIEHAVDPSGGFVGALTDDLVVHNEAPRSGVVCARILWTYAAAYRRFGRPEYLLMAQHAFAYLTGRFWDRQHGGIYWQIDAQGQPVSARKHSYAQAFAIYGLAEYHLATGDGQSLALARKLFALLERHAHDVVYGGYIEGCGPAWDALADMRLSDKEPNCRKSMNTLLHILEGYSNLLRAWDDPLLRSRLRELLGIFLEHVLEGGAHRFRLFFDDAWQPMPDHISYGHDIEGSWLLVEAAELLDEPVLLELVREEAVAMAHAVCDGGLEADGSVVYERRQDGSVDATKHWWAQAEGVVGFYNAFQLSGDDRFLAASLGCWQVIRDQFVDSEHGEWFKVLDPAGRPVPGQYKVGPWECPYHHGRMCLELLARIGG
jgi:cellobiose epimerase